MEHEKVYMAVKYPSHILQRHEGEVQTYAQIALFALLQPNTSLGVARVAAQFLPEVGGRNCSAKQGFAVAKRMRN